MIIKMPDASAITRQRLANAIITGNKYSEKTHSTMASIQKKLLIYGDAYNRNTVEYLTTNVTDSSFDNNEVIYNKEILSTSPFTDFGRDGDENVSKYGHYFNLTGLDQSYVYTFETTAANFNQKEPDDTIIVLFNSQTKPLIASQQEYWDDDGGEGFLSKLDNIGIPENWCLAVTTFYEQKTGTFTLKITRSSQ